MHVGCPINFMQMRLFSGQWSYFSISVVFVLIFVILKWIETDTAQRSFLWIHSNDSFPIPQPQYSLSSATFNAFFLQLFICTSTQPFLAGSWGSVFLTFERAKHLTKWKRKTKNNIRKRESFWPNWNGINRFAKQKKQLSMIIICCLG